MSKNPTPRTWRVFIVEDHPVFREGLREMVNGEKGLLVCGEAPDTTTALREIRRLNPDLALVDITMPNGSGLKLIRKLRTSNRKIKLLVVSMHDEAVYANRVLRAGGDGYIMKQENPEEIVHAIHDVLSGHTYLSEEILNNAGKVAKRSAPPKTSALDQLTDDELEILEWLGQGKSIAQIARLIQAEQTALTDTCARIRKKLGLRNLQALVRYAVRWIVSESQ